MQKKEKMIKILEEIGLTPKESLVYFTNLSLGTSTILEISKASNVKRTTVYDIVESLKKKDWFLLIYKVSNKNIMQKILNI